VDRQPSLVGNYDNGITLCTRCYDNLNGGLLPKFAAANHLQFGPIPEVLSVLSDIELRMISQVEAFVTVRRLDGGQYGTKDNIVNFFNDVMHVVKKLPRPASNIKLVFVRITGYQVREHLVRPDRIRAALHWLKAHNPLYADVIIDEELLARWDHYASQPQQVVIEADPAEEVQEDVPSEDTAAANVVHIGYFCTLIVV
jgi:hypothetical protein